MNSYFFTKIRQDRGITVKQAAEATGYKESTIYHVESGERSAPDNLVGPLANLYNCKKNWLTDTPGIFSIQDVIYYLKKMYSVGGTRHFEIHYTSDESKRLFAYAPEMSKFLEDWRSKKDALRTGQISQEQYLDWVYSITGSGVSGELSDKLWELRRKRSLEDPSTDWKLTDALKKPFFYYLQIETGMKIPVGNDKKMIAKVLQVTPEFLFDRFKFGNRQDFHIFLLAADLLFNIITLEPESRIFFDSPEINLFFERILAIEAGFQERKLTRAQYDVEWLKL